MDHSTLRTRIRTGDQSAFGRLFDELAGPVYRHALRVTGDWATAEDVVSVTFLEAWRLRENLRTDDESSAARTRTLGDREAAGTERPDGNSPTAGAEFPSRDDSPADLGLASEDGSAAGSGVQSRDGAPAASGLREHDGSAAGAVVPAEDVADLTPWVFGIAVNVLRNTTRAGRRYRNVLTRIPLDDVTPDFADALVGRHEDAARLAAARAALARLRRPEREVFTLCVWSGLDYAAAAQALDVPVGTIRSRLSRARARLRSLTDDELETAATKREPPALPGQVRGGRENAARSSTQGLR